MDVVIFPQLIKNKTSQNKETNLFKFWVQITHNNVTIMSFWLFDSLHGFWKSAHYYDCFCSLENVIKE